MGLKDNITYMVYDFGVGIHKSGFGSISSGSGNFLERIDHFVIYRMGIEKKFFSESLD